MGDTWTAGKKRIMDGFKRFFNGDEKFREKNSIKKCIEELEGIARKFDALKRRKKYCEDTEIRNCINNHINEIHIIIKSTKFQESALGGKQNEMDLLKDLRNSLEKPLRNAKNALERIDKGEFDFVKNECNE